MKRLLGVLIAAALPGLAAAQTPPSKQKEKAPAQDLVKKRGGKKVPKTAEEKIEVEDDPAVKLTDADLETAKKIFVGDIPCELGAKVHIAPLKREGFFSVRVGIQRFVMHPVESRTGAVRLEDPRAGAMWLQLGNKSMLMSQKFGMRLADECQSPEQLTVADDLKKNPRPSILDSTPGPQSTSTKVP